MTEAKQSIQRSYDQQSLLNDRSVNWKGFNKDELLTRLREDNAETPITDLRHPEVRYEVTDHCNAECIMCPREVHNLGRPHGIMSMPEYR